MNKGLALALLVVGAVLIAYGISASDSIGSEISEAFTGSPTDKAIWLLVAGIAAAIVGGFGLMRVAKAR